jgi:hypothetical protein
MSADNRVVWDDLAGQIVALDVSSPYLIVGRLDRFHGDWLVLHDADVHDLRDTATSRETYLVNTRLHGVHANRRATWVRLAEVVCISRLEDVLTD